jgi:SAM-dependent methyltransferase
MSFPNCPICGSNNHKSLLDLNCGNLDASSLYPIVRLLCCSDCGHGYNKLSPSETAGLASYYNEEYAPTNLRSIVKTGDLPGSASAITRNRYEHLFKLLNPHIQKNASILDVGCATGGFLDFLKGRGFSHLFGVEPTTAYLEQARLSSYNVRSGHAEALGYENDMFDALVIEQVMEHLFHPARAFKEAARVLKEGGVLCVGVPDASRYEDLYYFDFYWLLMREHIQHFTIQSLSQLAAQHGFELIEYQQTALPLMGESMVMPNLSASFLFKGAAWQRNHDKTAASPQIFENYVDKELVRLSEKKRLAETLVQEERPVYIWGIGREFLYLFEAAGIKHCDIRGLIDLNPFKQKNATVRGMKISPPEILAQAPQQSALIIGALAHKKDILQRITDLGYPGTVLEF